MKIGFIGLGAMGKAMAARLVAAGHEVTVWNRTRSAVDELVARGAHAAASPLEAAQNEVVHSMLVDDAAVRSVVIAGGVIDGMPHGSIHVNHATISVALAKELAPLHRVRSTEYVAAPVFGRPDAAAAGNLYIAVAGDPAAVDHVRPLLHVLGQRVWSLGDAPERANIVKIAGNFMLASAIESMAEACALTRAYGVDPHEFLDLMTNTTFAAPAFKTYAPLIADRRYSPPGYTLRLGRKDAGLTIEAAVSERVPLPFASVLDENFLDAAAHGDDKLDASALSEVTVRRANLDSR
jgi:3-hydroxyisobutyrate dehydrogenase-like beta-hydroxyacid dehydrogenase